MQHNEPALYLESYIEVGQQSIQEWWYEPLVLSHIDMHNMHAQLSGDKKSTSNYEWNLERMSNSSQSTRPVGRVLWEELLVEVIYYI